MVARPRDRSIGFALRLPFLRVDALDPSEAARYSVNITAGGLFSRGLLRRFLEHFDLLLWGHFREAGESLNRSAIRIYSTGGKLFFGTMRGEHLVELGLADREPFFEAIEEARKAQNLPSAALIKGSDLGEHGVAGSESNASRLGDGIEAFDCLIGGHRGSAILELHGRVLPLCKSPVVTHRQLHSTIGVIHG